MQVLIIGGGGREHALAWKLQASAQVDTVYCAPGNPNMRGVRCVDFEDHDQLAEFVKSQGIGLTVVGPEAPLCAGLVDVFRRRGLAVFGPNAAAARLEGSKSFAKDFMRRHGIPTAASAFCRTRAEAISYIRRQGAPIVVKADGLAAGKGVTVAETVDQAVAAVEMCFSGRFGAAGDAVVVEECLVGEEASIIALVDGRTILPLASSQDHKRIGENDTGSNTGGMGAYSPAPVVDDAMWEAIDRHVLKPFLRGCQEDGLDYRGVIYAGIIVTSEGPKVLEFNVRFGDPETQAILPRLQSDLAETLLATVEQRLENLTLQWAEDSAVCVVMAADGYPSDYRRGDIITGIGQAERQGALVFHAGTGKNQSGDTVTSGGRVLGVTGLDRSLPRAIEKTYAAVRQIDWSGAYYRRDIGRRGCQARND